MGVMRSVLPGVFSRRPERTLVASTVTFILLTD